MRSSLILIKKRVRKIETQKGNGDGGGVIEIASDLWERNTDEYYFENRTRGGAGVIVAPQTLSTDDWIAKAANYMVEVPALTPSDFRD